MRYVTLFLGIALLIAAVPSTHAKQKLESRWLDREVVIDGLNNEWQGAMVGLDGAAASLGVMNDDTHLYICLKSVDERTSVATMARGLILRLEPKGGSGGLGIRFPVGIDPAQALASRSQSGEQDRAPQRKAFQDSLSVVEIFQPGEEEGQRLALDPGLGFSVRADLAEGMLTYELKIPLSTSDLEPYAIGAEAGKVLTVAFETPRIGLAEPRERIGGRQGGGPGGGPPGGPGGGGREGGMNRPGGGRPGGPDSKGERPEPLNIKARIRLAAGAGSDGE